MCGFFIADFLSVFFFNSHSGLIFHTYVRIRSGHLTYTWNPRAGNAEMEGHEFNTRPGYK